MAQGAIFWLWNTRKGRGIYGRVESEGMRKKEKERKDILLMIRIFGMSTVRDILAYINDKACPLARGK